MGADAGRLLDVPGVCRLATGASTLQLRIDGADGEALLRGTNTDVPHGVVARRGRTADLIGIGWGNVFAITERTRNVLQSSGLTGWYANPIDIEPDPVFGGPV